MFAVNAVRRAAAAAIKTESSRRAVSTYGDIVVSPPTFRISFTEKLAHGFLLFVGVMGYPIFTMFQMAEIRREEYAAMEIPEEWEQWREQQKK